MSIQSITPQEAAELVKNGAVVVDIRCQREFDRKHITDSVCIPRDNMSSLDLPAGKPVIFSCLSGMRTRHNAAFLEKCACDCAQVYLLQGGMNAWERAGLPVEKKAGEPLDIMRQVQIAAGLLVLLGVILGAFVSPWFYFLSAFVGAGLMFAGITGFCGMARLLMCMPWNRS
ncbi:MAG: rhodanese family protein [Neisseria sp.]|nr:rhodanese family protein [Neisseria sp.]